MGKSIHYRVLLAGNEGIGDFLEGIEHRFAHA